MSTDPAVPGGSDPAVTFAEVYELAAKIERERPVLMVGLGDYERVEAAAHRLPIRPEVIWNPYLPEGICVSTTIGALTAEPFTQTEGA